MKPKGKYFIFLIVAVLQLSSCTNDDKANNSDETSLKEGQIYYRWTQNIENIIDGGDCGYKSGNYKDNNDAVPDFALENTYYGPCQQGTYAAQFDIDVFSPGQSIYTFSYTLEKPQRGYVRYYTKILLEYYPSANRCLTNSRSSSSLTFNDVKL